MSEAFEVGKKLVELCRQGKHKECMDELYSHHIVSVEAGAPPGGSATSQGIEAVKGKAEWWEANHEVHKHDVEGPYPHGDRFIVHFKYDVTGKAGPMAGKRFVMDEAALYTVKDGKITHE